MEQKKFALFIKQLPTLLKSGWKIPDEGRIDKRICPDEDYFACEYVGEAIPKALLIICKKCIRKPNQYDISLSPTADEIHKLEKLEIIDICNHFENTLEKQGVKIEIHVIEEEDK